MFIKMTRDNIHSPNTLDKCSLGTVENCDREGLALQGADIPVLSQIFSDHEIFCSAFWGWMFYYIFLRNCFRRFRVGTL